MVEPTPINTNVSFPKTPESLESPVIPGETSPPPAPLIGAKRPVQAPSGLRVSRSPTIGGAR
jgi:hypothetical protein